MSPHIKTDSLSSLVFVYGTLKRGGRWHELMRGARFLGPAKTTERYVLLVKELAIRIPFLLEENAGHRIIGELFEVGPNTLLNLDHLEQHPHWYQRKMKEVKITNGVFKNQTRQAYIYFLRKENYHREGFGDWRERPMIEEFFIPQD